MDVVRTVLGDIDAHRLGWCECRDHLFIADGRISEDIEAPYTDDYDNVVAALVCYKNAGGGTIIDGQTLGRGRMGSSLVKAAQQTDIPIVASTGFNIQALYTNNFIFALEKVAMEKLFINELTFGMVGKNREYLASYCAGIIKTGIDADGICKNAISEKLFSAAARAAAKTGAPVMVYVGKDASAMDVVKFFSDNGVVPGRMILCHQSAESGDAAMHEALLDAGVYISYDAATLGDGIAPQMVRLGHIDHLILSSSHPDNATPFDALLNAQDELLQRLGIDNDALDILMRQNPSNALRIRK